MSSIIEVKKLYKSYGAKKAEVPVLRDINFQVDDGEIVVVMGPSGSGKSTLLYTVSSMEPLTSGKVVFIDRDISKLGKKAIADVRLKDMGFIFQQMYMLKNLSVFDNIVLPAYQAKRVHRTEINAYAEKLMKKLGISDIADSDITEISGGQLQRACICRSLINKPAIIFADEPTGSLNKQSSIDVMDEIIDINKEGTAVLIVTHDVRVAARSDRVLYLIDGKIHGEFSLGKYTDEQTLKSREKKLNDWLLEVGW